MMEWRACRLPRVLSATLPCRFFFFFKQWALPGIPETQELFRECPVALCGSASRGGAAGAGGGMN